MCHVPRGFANTILLMRWVKRVFLIAKTEVVPMRALPSFYLFYKFFIDKKLGKMLFNIIFAKEV